MVLEVLVAIGDHRSPSVPALAPDDVDRIHREGVGGPDDGADVGVVLEVLDGDVQLVAAGVDVRDDGVHLPVAVGVDDVATVTVCEQFRVEVFFRGQRHPGVFLLPGADADAGFEPLGRPLSGGAVGLRLLGRLMAWVRDVRLVFVAHYAVFSFF